MDLKPGYWRVGVEYDSILSCHVAEACLGGSDPTTQCREGHTGPYCSVCDEGYTMTTGGICVSCANGDSSIFVALIPIIAFLVFLLMYYAWVKRHAISNLLNSSNKQLAENVPNNRLKSLKTKFKILLAFVQIISQLPTVLNVTFPLSFMTFILILSIFNINFIAYLHIGCIYHQNFYDELVQVTIAPFIMFFVVLIVLTIRLVIAYRINDINPSYDHQKYRRGTIFAALIISFVLFSPVSIVIFQSFACETFDDGNSYLIADYSINCDTPEHSFYIAYASIMVLIYPVGVPLTYLILLRLEKDKVNPRTELVVRADERDLVSDIVIQHEKIKLRDSYEELKYISFLYETYQPRRWYFEIIDCFRRLTLTAIPVLILRGTMAQIVLVLLISLTCVAAYTELKPFIRKSDNLVAISTQWSITLTLIIAVMLRSDDSQDKTLLGVMALLVNLFVFALTIGITIVGDDDEDQLLESNNKPVIKRKTKLKLSNIIDKNEEEELQRLELEKSKEQNENISIEMIPPNNPSRSKQRTTSADVSSLSGGRSSLNGKQLSSDHLHDHQGNQVMSITKTRGFTTSTKLSNRNIVHNPNNNVVVDGNGSGSKSNVKQQRSNSNVGYKANENYSTRTISKASQRSAVDSDDSDTLSNEKDSDDEEFDSVSPIHRK